MSVNGILDFKKNGHAAFVHKRYPEMEIEDGKIQVEWANMIAHSNTVKHGHVADMWIPQSSAHITTGAGNARI